MLPCGAAVLPEQALGAMQAEGCTAPAQAAFPQPTLLQPCYLPFVMET